MRSACLARNGAPSADTSPAVTREFTCVTSEDIVGTTLFIATVGVGALLAGLVFLRKWVAGGRKASAPPIGHSLRIGTFNTHLDSLIFRVAKDKWDFLLHRSALVERYETDVRQRAEGLASRILLGGYGYDFFALIEVFSEEAREILVARLSGTYPWFIRKLPEIDAPVPKRLLARLSALLAHFISPHKEDSGLMLFSRFPIERTEFAPFTFRNDDEILAAFPDSFAEKGAAYAKIRDPRNGRAYHVILAHLQENEEKWAWVRTAELQQIREFIERLEIDVATEELFVMGDLNLNGLWTNLELPPKPQTIEDLVPAPSSPEWKHHFGNPASFFGSTLHDTWFRETSRRDAGATSGGGERIDYILHNDASTPNRRDLRIQHLTLAYNLFNPDGASLSDHMGVNADLNVSAPHCNPREALLLSSFGTKPVLGEISDPGSMVWYRIDEPGTYSFAVIDGSGVSFDLYASTDLSRPVRQYKKETTVLEDDLHNEKIGRKFHLLNAPYYLRVFHEDRTRVTGYAFLAYKHKGTNANDAIALSPFAPLWSAMPSGKPLNELDAIWFELHTESADSGTEQDLLFRLSAFTKTMTRLEVRAADETTVLDGIEATGGESLLTLHRKDRGPSKMYVLVRRDDATFASADFVVEWRTNLKILHGWQAGVEKSQQLLVICDNETNPEAGGSDDIILRMWVDGALRVDRHVGRFEATDSVSLEPVIPPAGFHYLESIGVQFIEDDHFSGDDESSIQTIPPPETYRTPPTDQVVNEFAGGRYIFQFNQGFEVHPEIDPK
jgi:endonuclease/exonuclease/phosphatase family metal-dependent hydrolase